MYKAIKAVFKVALAVVVLGGSLNVASAAIPILLTINDSNPSAVTITATGVNSAVNFDSTVNEGVDLLSFFSVDEAGMDVGQDSTGNLQGGGSEISYNAVYSDNDSSAGGANFDLKLYVDDTSPGSGTLENFSTTQAAFTGSWTFDLSSFGVDPSALPAAGTDGEILSGNSLSSVPGEVIGDWQVVSSVPEPATTSLLALGALMMGVVLYRRRATAIRAALADL